MDNKTINKLKKYLTEDQLTAYLEYSNAFNTYRIDRKENSFKTYEITKENFLLLTNGKLPCEIIPITVW
jgi:phage regulator Rha-like protein